MKHYLFFITISFLIIGCEKDEPVTPIKDKEELPPITMEGLNTFGCLINDSIWLPKKNTSNPITHRLIAHYREIPLRGRHPGSIEATIDFIDDSINVWEVIIISFWDLKGENIYNGENGLYKEAGTTVTFKRWHPDPNLTYELDTTRFHEIVITKIDEANNIISGVFEFTLQNTNDPLDKKGIAEGRFDVVYSE